MITMTMILIIWIAQLYNWAVQQLYNCTTEQHNSCTTVQLTRFSIKLKLHLQLPAVGEDAGQVREALRRSGARTPQI